MHFALPPRKTSFPPPYARASVRSAASQRRKSIQLLSYVVLCLLTLYMVSRWFKSSRIVEDNGTIPSSSSVLIVTVLDEGSMDDEQISMVKTNREDYATRHGYKTLYVNLSDYTHLTGQSPTSWTLIPALRHALTLYPKVDYIWSLSSHAFIMNSTLSLHNHIFSPLSSLMQKDLPVVPPDSVIHTFSHIKPSQAYLIITQDIDNLAHTSFLLRNTQTIPVAKGKAPDSWAQFMLDAWFDPLYRNYAFQKAENHALEHLVQWHPTVLAKLVIVDQRLLNSYNYQPPKMVYPDRSEPRTHDSMWQPGDFVINFKGCHESEQRDCAKEMKDYFVRWRAQMEKNDGQKIDMKTYVSSTRGFGKGDDKSSDAAKSRKKTTPPRSNQQERERVVHI